jgi:heat shock protein 5
MTKDNHQLGQFDVTGIPPAPRGTAKIDVTFQLDENSILTVIAKEMGSEEKSITIANDKGRLTASEIERMINDAAQHAEQDALLREKLEAKQ